MEQNKNQLINGASHGWAIDTVEGRCGGGGAQRQKAKSDGLRVRGAHLVLALCLSAHLSISWVSVSDWCMRECVCASTVLLLWLLTRGRVERWIERRISLAAAVCAQLTFARPGPSSGAVFVDPQGTAQVTLLGGHLGRFEVPPEHQSAPPRAPSPPSPFCGPRPPPCGTCGAPLYELTSTNQLGMGFITF